MNPGCRSWSSFSRAFMMGSTEPERRWARDRVLRGMVDREKPQHRVAIPEPLADGKHPVTRGQFAVFVEATAHDMSGDCWVYTGSTWEKSSSADWCSPGFEQTDDHPVVCVELGIPGLCEVADQGDQPVLPSALRGGMGVRLPRGNDDPLLGGQYLPTPKEANFGRNMRRTTEIGCLSVDPMGSPRMHGNVWEWVEDCWNGAIRAPRATAVPGRAAIVAAGCFAGAPGATERGSSARPTASGTAPTTGAPASGLGLPRRSAESEACPLKPRSPYLLRSGAKPSFSAPFAPRGAPQRTLWEGCGQTVRMRAPTSHNRRDAGPRPHWGQS